MTRGPMLIPSDGPRFISACILLIELFWLLQRRLLLAVKQKKNHLWMSLPWSRLATVNGKKYQVLLILSVHMYLCALTKLFQFSSVCI